MTKKSLFCCSQELLGDEALDLERLSARFGLSKRAISRLSLFHAPAMKPLTSLESQRLLYRLEFVRKLLHRFAPHIQRRVAMAAQPFHFAL